MSTCLLPLPRPFQDVFRMCVRCSRAMAAPGERLNGEDMVILPESFRKGRLALLVPLACNVPFNRKVQRPCSFYFSASHTTSLRPHDAV